MSVTEVIISAFEWNWRMVNEAIEDLDDEAIIKQPNAECNSVARLL